MTTPHSTESPRRKTALGILILFAATAAACGGSTQSGTGIAPSSVQGVAASSDASGTFSPLKVGQGKGRGTDGDAPAADAPPTTGAEPAADGEQGSSHGRSAIQIEGFTTSITGGCPDLTIVIGDQTVTTNVNTEFQRADCTDLEPATITAPTLTSPTTNTTQATEPSPTDTSFHLHIAAQRDADTGDLIATYVRMQGPKGDDGQGEDTDSETPTTGTTPTTDTTSTK